MSIEELTQRFAAFEKTITTRLDNIDNRLRKLEGGAAASGGSVEGYKALIDQHIEPMVELSKNMDSVVQEVVKKFKDIANTQLEFLQNASKISKPGQEKLQEMIAPISKEIMATQEIPEKNRNKKEVFDHIKAVSEACPAFGWIVVEPAPAPYVGEFIGPSQFYSNKILRQYKGKDEKQVEWVGHLNDFLKDLQNYVKANHTTGVSWNKA